MGSEAALAFQIMSGLTGAIGNFGAARQADKRSRIAPNMGVYDAATAQQLQAIDSEVDLQNKQADTALAEASAEANRVAREGALFEHGQALAYTSSGVTLEGSPLLVLEETRRLNKQEIDAITRRGEAQANLYHQRGYQVGVTGRTQLATDRADFLSKVFANQAEGRAQASSLRRQTVSDLGRLFANGLYIGGLLRNKNKNPLVNAVQPPPSLDPNDYYSPINGMLPTGAPVPGPNPYP